MRLSISRGELFENAILNILQLENDSSVSHCYDLGGTAYPLYKKAILSLQVNEPNKYPHKKYYMRLKTKKGYRSVGGTLNDGWITTNITVLGCYDVAVDTVAPVVKLLAEKNWSKNGKINFLIKDTETGVSSYKGYIDDKFILFEFCSKNGRLSCNLKREGIKRGKHKLKLHVSDVAGNETIVEKNIVY